jgi:hypothetical protein
MSEENVEVARRVMEAVQREDWDAVVAELDANVEIDDRDIIESGQYRGHPGFFKWLDDWGGSWDSWRIEDIDYRAREDVVVALFRMEARGRGSGIELVRDDALVFELRSGKVARLGYHNDQAEALEAAGLSE